MDPRRTAEHVQHRTDAERHRAITCSSQRPWWENDRGAHRKSDMGHHGQGCASGDHLRRGGVAQDVRPSPAARAGCEVR
jgi:hypothetical protein